MFIKKVALLIWYYRSTKLMLFDDIDGKEKVSFFYASSLDKVLILMKFN